MFETTLRIDLLGHLRIRLEQQEIKLGPARQQAILAVLADHLGRVVPRDELIHSVWGASPPASVDGNVHTYISGLRRVLEPERARWSGGEVLLSEPPGYRLRLPPHSIDLATFHDLRDRASERRTAGDHEGVVQRLDSALALWRGEAFGGLPGPFAERRRAELSEERLAVVEQRLESLLALGEHSDLVPELEALVQEHPLRESLWETLITALHRAGRRMEALERIAHLRGVLREHLGVEPGTAIRLLHHQLLAGDPALATPEPNVRRRSKPGLLSVIPEGVTRPQLAGRELETARLRSCIRDLETRRGRSVLVEGDAGIGKSALLSAVLASIEPRCHHLAWAVAEKSCLEPLGALSRALGMESDVSITMNDVLKRVEQLCANASLVLVIDDLHLADDASLLVWDQLCLATRSLPVLMMATARSDVDSSAFARLRRGIATRDDVIMPLRPLSRAASCQLIHQVVGMPPGPALHALTTNALGNPLVLRQTIAMLLRDNAIRAEGGAVDLHGDGGVGSAERALAASMTARLDRLSHDALETLRAAAVLGQRFTTSELAAVVGRWPSQLLDVLDEALRAKVLAHVGQSLTFAHPAQRRALYDGTPLDMLPPLHRRAARSLADSGAPVERVCDQLAAVSDGQLDSWVVEWLVSHDDELTACAPLPVFWVLNQALDTCPADHPHRGVLVATRARFLCQFGT
ncbi:BTAD domain-containing putative transcriptional regulator [Lentzea sp. NPDC102401]|uniref:BTAD domain-containing putative transcriptional regulator n=1 Tax=Lentzea sp. NPDC102401 TaxID=3364128 RepID=UPI00382DD154